MACQFCQGPLFKDKLGRCKTCMLLNFILLLASAIGWFGFYQESPKQVDAIALLLAFIASALLMVLHISAYLYYRCKGIKNPTQDKAHLK